MSTHVFLPYDALIPDNQAQQSIIFLLLKGRVETKMCLLQIGFQNMLVKNDNRKIQTLTLTKINLVSLLIILRIYFQVTKDRVLIMQGCSVQCRSIGCVYHVSFAFMMVHFETLLLSCYVTLVHS